MRGFVTAIRTLTMLPCPGRDAEDLSRALPFFPLIGALLGGLTALIAWGVATSFHWMDGAAVACVIATALVTRGLHLDGLADTADALGGGRTTETRLRIMKDPHTGAFGVIAVVGDLLIRYVAIAQIICFDGWRWLVIPAVLSRTVMVKLAVALPYARAEGGTAESFVRNARPWHWAVAVLLGAGCCYAAAGILGLLFMPLVYIFALLLMVWMRRLFGGVTGDLLGWANEVVECVLYAILALVVPHLQTMGVDIFW